jgi:AcrR family transcriptional regulator
MTDDPRPPLSGRRAQAARNDGRILDAARAVFLADPEAPVSAVAARAGVGISALYRRYPSKEDLLRALAQDGLERFVADLEVALADPGDPWDAYSACLARVLDGRSQALAQRLAGTFRTTPETVALAIRAGDLHSELHGRTQRAGALRDDVTPGDVILLLETVMLLDVPAPDGGAALRRRYLALLLQALHAPARGPLPAPPPTDDVLAARWRARGPLHGPAG